MPEKMQAIRFNMSESSLRKLITLAKKNNSSLGAELRKAIEKYINDSWKDMQKGE